MAKKVQKNIIRSAYTKSQTINTLVERTGLPKAQVQKVLDEFFFLIRDHVQSNGPGYYTWPGILKVETVVKPAVQERQRINPFTGKKTLYKAQPSKKTIKIKALKQLKDLVDSGEIAKS